MGKRTGVYCAVAVLLALAVAPPPSFAGGRLPVHKHSVTVHAASDVELRPATGEDLPWIAGTVLSMMMSPLGLDPVNFLVAEGGSGGGKLGFGQIRALGKATGPALLASLFVLPEARGRGVGSWIVKGLLERRRARGLMGPVFALTLEPKLPFFEKLGFEVVPKDREGELPPALAVEASVGRVIAPLASGKQLIVLRFLPQSS